MTAPIPRGNSTFVSNLSIVHRLSINPFILEIQKSILLSVCHKFMIISTLKICRSIKYNRISQSFLLVQYKTKMPTGPMSPTPSMRGRGPIGPGGPLGGPIRLGPHSKNSASKRRRLSSSQNLSSSTLL